MTTRPRQTECYMGHAYTAENLRVGRTTINGRTYVVRRCRVCERRNQRLRRTGRSG
jgi:hypothetical protein